MSDKLKRKQTVSRAEAAQQLRTFADQLDQGAVGFAADGGADHPRHAVADDVDLEIELKTTDRRTELEIELTWTSSAEG